MSYLSDFYAKVGLRFKATTPTGTPHKGQDFPWKAGTVIPAFRGGTVVRAALDEGYGWLLAVQSGGGAIDFYCHQSIAPHAAPGVYWKVGDRIKQGDQVGTVGDTGDFAIGAHLHVGVTAYLNSSKLPTGAFDTFLFNPLPIIQNAIAASHPAGGDIDPIIPDPKGFDMPQNFNSHGTIFTLGETFGILWTSTASFSYGTNMKAFGAPVVVDMTADQIATAINEANARGAAFSATAAGQPTLTAADVDAILKDDFQALHDQVAGLVIPPGTDATTILNAIKALPASVADELKARLSA